MAVTRRTVIQALAATGIGAIAGTGAYGFLYGRHELELTTSTVPVVGLPAALSGTRIRTHHRHPSSSGCRMNDVAPRRRAVDGPHVPISS